ncbi:hypothetical protein VTK56DRAFT_8899 [Thermocarpiscus australiensis]
MQTRHPPPASAQRTLLAAWDSQDWHLVRKHHSHKRDYGGAEVRARSQNLGKQTKRTQALLSLQDLCNLEFRPGRSDINWTRAVNVEATLMTITGDVQASPCDNFNRNAGRIRESGTGW